MSEILQEIFSFVALGLESIAVLVILYGGVETLFSLVRPLSIRQPTQGLRRSAWLSFARWLMLGLEYTLAADIVRTAIAPSWQDIGQLGAIAFIRTFLNFFLERDLGKEN